MPKRLKYPRGNHPQVDSVIGSVHYTPRGQVVHVESANSMEPTVRNGTRKRKVSKSSVWPVSTRKLWRPKGYLPCKHFV